MLEGRLTEEDDVNCFIAVTNMGYVRLYKLALPALYHQWGLQVGYCSCKDEQYYSWLVLDVIRLRHVYF